MYSQIPCQTYKICKIRNYLHISEINGAQLSRKFVDNTIKTCIHQKIIVPLRKINKLLWRCILF